MLRAKHTLYCSLDASEINLISTCDAAKEIWVKLHVTYEGTIQVKESKISMRAHKYELLKWILMNLSIMFTRFTDIINGLKSLCKVYSNAEMVRKILRCLSKSWGPKVTTIQEAKDLRTLNLDQLMGSLMTHEIEMKADERKMTTRKRRT